MNDSVAQQLLALNRTFYDQVAEPFADSRTRPQPGFSFLLEHLPKPCPTLLDLGCGEGRLGRFLLAHNAIGQYTGVDFSSALLEIAAANTSGIFIERDLTQPGCLDGLDTGFTAIACLAALQHIPGRASRIGLLQEMRAHLAEHGRVLLSTWQFTESERQQRKIVSWSEVGLSAKDVETRDYLLTWQRGKEAYRYVRLIDAEETISLAHEAGFQVLHQFRSDGKEGNLGLYSVLALTDEERLSRGE